MRQMSCLAVLALCLISISGCDSEQPQQTSGQTMQIEIDTGNASVGVFDVWEQYFDVNNDGIPDETDPLGNILIPPLQTACRRALDRSSAIINRDDAVTHVGRTPWNYSLEISIIRAGTTVIQRLTTTDALKSTFNMTRYSDTFLTGAQVPGTDCPTGAICNQIGRLTSTHRIVIDSTYNFHPNSNELLPLDENNRWDLICPGSPVLGNPRMNGTLTNPLPPPFTMDLQKGDTILVKARKNITPPEGVELNSEPVLLGAVFLDGRRIMNLTGTSVSAPDQAAGISFSFTVN